MREKELNKTLELTARLSALFGPPFSRNIIMNDWLPDAAWFIQNKDYILTGNKAFSFNEINEKAISLAHFLQKYYKRKEGILVG